MTGIEELLAKLKKLDPATWEKLEKMSDRVDVEYEDYCIQGVIQDAIKVPLCFAFQKMVIDGSFEANIWNIARPLESIWYAGDSPAEALLAAYIAFLEAEAAR